MRHLQREGYPRAWKLGKLLFVDDNMRLRPHEITSKRPARGNELCEGFVRCIMLFPWK